MAPWAYLNWNCSLLLLDISVWETLYDYNNQQPHWDFSYFNKHLIEKLFSRFLQYSLHPWSPTDFVRNWQLVSNFSYFKTIFDDFFPYSSFECYWNFFQDYHNQTVLSFIWLLVFCFSSISLWFQENFQSFVMNEFHKTDY